jgi:hypothetical protein
MTDTSSVGPDVEVTMMLCDAAQVANGKLYILGGGVNAVGPNPQPLALAIRITLPWDRANIPHTWRIDLVDEDGHPVQGRNEKPVALEGRLEAGRPAGLRPGSPLSVSLALNVAAIALSRGKSYTFRLSIEGETRPQWRVAFLAREKPTTQG